MVAGGRGWLCVAGAATAKSPDSRRARAAHRGHSTFVERYVAVPREDIVIADISDNGPGPEALLQAIASQAARASRSQLTVLLVLATLGAVAATGTMAHEFALALAIGTLCAATAVLALWELRRRATARPTRSRAATQRILAAVGVLLWFLSGMALLLVLLGAPWKL